MKIEIVGFVGTRIESMLAYRKIIDPTLSLLDVKVVIDTVTNGNPIQIDVDPDNVEKLVAAGFGVSYPTQNEIKQLMSQLIQRFLSLGMKKYAKQLITIWIELQQEGEEDELQMSSMWKRNL